MKTFIDCHNHSLPFIDDGAKSMKMGLEMLKISCDDGVKEIVLTPHHLNGAFINQKNQIHNAFNEFTEIAKKEIPNINLHLGSEIHLVESCAKEILDDLALTYGDQKKAALIELSKHNIPYGSEKVLGDLLYNGITPVIAHPERNSALRKDYSLLKEWIDMGCKAQLTAMSFDGDFGKSIQHISQRFIEEGLIHVIASDAHRPTGRSPILSKTAANVRERYSEEVAQTLFYENPKRLINGEDLLDIQIEDFKQNKKKRFKFF